MGIAHNGIPTEWILKFRDEYELNTFVETGTAYGYTAEWASKHFDRVITIEKSLALHEKAVQRFGARTNIEFVLGDSRAALARIVSGLTEPAVFWLDAHWDGDGTSSGQDDPCPLVEELRQVGGGPVPHFLFIDDARLLCSPPPLPHEPHAWPTIDEVIEALRATMTRPYIVIFEDVVVAVPDYARQSAAGYFQSLGTAAWEKHTRAAVFERQPAIRRGLALTASGLRLMAVGVHSFLWRSAHGFLHLLRRKAKGRGRDAGVD